MTIRPLHDGRQARARSAGGIVIPATTSERPTFGKVIAVGPDKVLDSGQTRALVLKVGDRVLFGKYSGTEVKVDNQDLSVMREDDVLAIVD